MPKPDLVGPHQSANPMFATPEQLNAWRTRVGLSVIACLILVGMIYLAYGPLFAIRDVTVTGTRLLNPASVQQAADRYLDSQRWLILPNRTLWILSSTGLASNLEKQIRQRISIERVMVEKQRPHGLKIIISERTPVANWTNGSLIGTVDGQGKIIELRSSNDSNFPIVRDESEKIFTVDASVVKPEVVVSLKFLVGYMRQANIEVAEYLIPLPVCPVPIVPETNTNTSSTNTNSSATNANIASRNTNATPSNVNANVTTTLPCDREALRFSSQEIHAQLQAGPRVLFDRHAKLGQSVQALKRVLSERSDKVPKTIDVRFGDRVYVQ